MFVRKVFVSLCPNSMSSSLGLQKQVGISRMFLLEKKDCSNTEQCEDRGTSSGYGCCGAGTGGACCRRA